MNDILQAAVIAALEAEERAYRTVPWMSDSRRDRAADARAEVARAKRGEVRGFAAQAQDRAARIRKRLAARRKQYPEEKGGDLPAWERAAEAWEVVAEQTARHGPRTG